MATAYAAGVPLPVAILLGFVIAALIGLANGLITLSFGIPSFITTLGMLFIVRTSAPFIVGYARSLNFKPPPGCSRARSLRRRSFGPIPTQFIWFIGLALLCYLILNRHFLGNHFFAAGGNPHAARFAGINVFRTKLFAFMLSLGLRRGRRAFQHHAAPDGDDQSAALHRAVRGGDLRDRRAVAVRRPRLGDRHRARRRRSCSSSRT